MFKTFALVKVYNQPLKKVEINDSDYVINGSIIDNINTCVNFVNYYSTIKFDVSNVEFVKFITFIKATKFFNKEFVTRKVVY